MLYRQVRPKNKTARGGLPRTIFPTNRVEGVSRVCLASGRNTGPVVHTARQQGGEETLHPQSKNGTPDRRFSNNRQIPVVLYAQLGLSSSTGLNIVLESSDPRKAATFKAGIDKYSTSRK